MKYKVDIYDTDKPIKVKLDKRNFVDGVPVTSSFDFKLKIRSDIREVKYRIKSLFKRK